MEETSTASKSPKTPKKLLTQSFNCSRNNTSVDLLCAVNGESKKRILFMLSKLIISSQ